MNKAEFTNIWQAIADYGPAKQVQYVKEFMQTIPALHIHSLL